MPDQTQSTQGGGQQQGGAAAQTANTQGDVRQMRVDDIINLANQQNLDVSALNDLLSKIQVSPDVNVSGTGQAGGGQPAQAQAGSAQVPQQSGPNQ